MWRIWILPIIVVYTWPNHFNSCLTSKRRRANASKSSTIFKILKIYEYNESIELSTDSSYGRIISTMLMIVLGDGFNYLEKQCVWQPEQITLFLAGGRPLCEDCSPIC